MKYKIIQSDNLDSLQTAVNEAIKDGWQPLGGVIAIAKSYYRYTASHWFAQTMIRILADTNLKPYIDKDLAVAKMNTFNLPKKESNAG